MEYNINEKGYVIEINGSDKEIKKMIEILNGVIPGDSEKRLSQIEDKLNNLEKITKPEQFDFNIHHRIYFNNKTILYRLNESGKDEGFFFSVWIKPCFKKALEKLEK